MIEISARRCGKTYQAAIDKLIADGVITQEADGRIRMTEKSWRAMLKEK